MCDGYTKGDNPNIFISEYQKLRFSDKAQTGDTSALGSEHSILVYQVKVTLQGQRSQ